MKALLRFAAQLLVLTILTLVQHGPLAADARSSKPSDERPAATRQQKVDLNLASQAELEALPGVGPVTAKDIIAARPFKSVSDLKNVSGIGDAKYKQLRPMVTVNRTAGSSGRSDRAVSSGAPASATSDSRTSAAEARTAVGSGKSAASQGKINLNTASQAELESLPGIGPVKAKAIIDGRPYKSTEDVMKVKGIKEGTFNEIKDQITVR